MGLSNFPSPSEGVLPILVMNTVMSVAILKNLLKSVLQLMGCSNSSYNFEEESSSSNHELCPPNNRSTRRSGRRISITQFKNLSDNNNNNNNNSKYSSNFAPASSTTIVECCVCLCKFGEEEEVSELSCKHFFHKNCLDKWFDNHHTTCPLCRSIH